MVNGAGCGDVRTVRRALDRHPGYRARKPWPEAGEPLPGKRRAASIERASTARGAGPRQVGDQQNPPRQL
jgi:hypothetical protein